MASGRMAQMVTLKNKGISQILFFATNHPWVADAKAKFPMQAMRKIKIPWGQDEISCRIRSELKINIKGNMAVRISYMNPWMPVAMGGDLAMAAAA